MTMLKEEVKRSFRSILGIYLAKPALASFKKKTTGGNTEAHLSLG
jgi:fatty acid/phospholipid biosynthesis enzyme